MYEKKWSGDQFVTGSMTAGDDCSTAGDRECIDQRRKEQSFSDERLIA
jgi:hypothetical protein